MVSGEVDFIEPDSHGKYHKEKFDVSDREVEELKNLISNVASQILSFSFFDKTCDDRDCEYCKLGKLVGSIE
jgi:DNA helicase-2/ATP-dependent DNA helicase PcrA